MGVMTLWCVTVWSCRAKTVPGRAGCPKAAPSPRCSVQVCWLLAFHHSSWEKLWWCGFFAGLSEEGFSWSFVPFPNSPMPFGKDTAAPGIALPGEQERSCTGNHSC